MIRLTVQMKITVTLGHTDIPLVYNKHREGVLANRDVEKMLVPSKCQLQFQWGCFEDSAWSFNRLEDWMALFTFMNRLLCLAVFLLTRSRVQGDS